MRAEIDAMKNQMNMQTIQNGALSAALTAAKNRIAELEADSVTEMVEKASKEHLPKMDLPREFFGKPNKDIEDFLLNCDMYIAARAPEFKMVSAAPLLALG